MFVFVFDIQWDIHFLGCFDFCPYISQRHLLSTSFAGRSRYAVWNLARRGEGLQDWILVLLRDFGGLLLLGRPPRHLCIEVHVALQSHVEPGKHPFSVHLLFILRSHVTCILEWMLTSILI